MSEKVTIGLRQRIPMSLLEMALTAVLSGDYSREYFAELAATEYNGKNRIAKTVTAISQLTDQNPLIDLLRENKDDVLLALRNRADRTLILSSLIIAKFEFAYDIFTLLGKYFHVQDQVVTSLITQKMSQKYGSNRSLPNAMNCALPMFIEAGIIHRPKIGFFEIRKVSPNTEIARRIFNEAFYLWNPSLSRNILYFSNPYYEYIDQVYGVE